MAQESSAGKKRNGEDGSRRVASTRADRVNRLYPSRTGSPGVGERGRRRAPRWSRPCGRPDDSPEVLFGLGEALWWLGEIRESVRCWEQAYVAFRRPPDPVQAANVALQLSFLYQANLGNDAAAAGWAAHAARLVDEFDLEPMRGWVFLIEGVWQP